MAIEATSALLQGLKQSKLLTSDQLQQATELAGQIGDARRLAGHLVQLDFLTRWQASQLLSGNNRLTLGKFRLLEPLGWSQQGRVYLADDPQAKRMVAIRIGAKQGNCLGRSGDQAPAPGRAPAGRVDDDKRMSGSCNPGPCEPDLAIVSTPASVDERPRDGQPRVRPTRLPAPIRAMAAWSLGLLSLVAVLVAGGWLHGLRDRQTPIARNGPAAWTAPSGSSATLPAGQITFDSLVADPPEDSMADAGIERWVDSVPPATGSADSAEMAIPAASAPALMESPLTESLSPAGELPGAESNVPSSATASHPDSQERQTERLEASPFAALAQVVELPPSIGEHEGTQSTSLGTVRLAPQALCFVRLLGGDALVPGAPVLELTNSLRGDTQWAWEIAWRDPPHPAVLTVASLAIEHDQLVFAWTPHSKTVSARGLLRNCALRLSAGPHTHQLALRTPVDVAPLPVNSQGKLQRLPLRIADLPDRDRLRIELTQVTGLPSVRFDPTPVLNGSGGTAWVVSGQAPEDQELRIRVDVASERSISLSTSAYYQWSSQQQPQRLVPTRVKRLLDQLIAQRQRTAQGLEVLDQSKNQRDLPRDQETFLLRQINLGQQQLAREEEAIRKLDGLLELCGQMNDSARIHFRVYFDAGGIEVELARSREPSADPRGPTRDPVTGE